MNMKAPFIDILAFLLQGEKGLGDITSQLNMTKPSALRHLNNMEELGMIRSRTIATSKGRERTFSLEPYCQIVSIDPSRGVLLFTSQFPLDTQNPLVGQIEQPDFREAVNIHLKSIIGCLGADFMAIIFGSVSRGNATSKSDIDLLLLRSDEWKSDETDKALEALYEGAILRPIQSKPIFWSTSRFLCEDSSTAKRIKNEGMVVYDALGDTQIWQEMKRYWNITI